MNDIMYLVILVLILLAMPGCSTTEHIQQDFDKTGKVMSIQVTTYETREALLDRYSLNSNAPYLNEDQIDGFSEYTMGGMECTIHAYRAPYSDSYSQTLGHELRPCLEGNWH